MIYEAVWKANPEHYGAAVANRDNALKFGVLYTGTSPDFCREHGIPTDAAKFRAFANGFIGATKDSLTEIEIENLVKATFSITIELASRFLDDYITGDKYFRCEYPKHNLVRTRCQLQLAKDIARKTDELEWIIRDVLEKCADPETL